MNKNKLISILFSTAIKKLGLLMLQVLLQSVITPRKHTHQKGIKPFNKKIFAQINLKLQ